MNMANNNATKVVTGMNTRLSYFHGWEPVSINGGAEKYSVCVLIRELVPPVIVDEDELAHSCRDLLIGQGLPVDRGVVARCSIAGMEDRGLDVSHRTRPPSS